MFVQEKEEEDDGDSNEAGEHEESYDNIEGAYNSKDYANLNVASDVRDLFQYIDRYKPQEVELDTPLKCFIPEYIPAIGELDPFLKVSKVIVMLCSCSTSVDTHISIGSAPRY